MRTHVTPILSLTRDCGTLGPRRPAAHSGAIGVRAP
jgi:hypothetical protein